MTGLLPPERELVERAQRGAVSGASYDEAWDGCAEYQPSSEEVEQWMRENWREVVPTPAAEEQAQTELPPMTGEQMLRLPRVDPMTHFALFSFIKGKDGVTRQPLPNRVQMLMFEAYLWLLCHGLPINIIVLKARQIGASEGTAELCYHHSRRFCLSGLMMADQHARTEKIWQLFCAKGAPGMDLYESGWGNRFTANSDKAKILWKDEDGRKCEAGWDRDTARDPKAGASGTRQIVWLSESARYAKEGAFRDTTVIGNVLNSVSDVPNAMRIAESTGEGGPSGWHFETFSKAVTLDERIAGRVGNGWIAIFVGWWECEDYALQESDATREFFDDMDARWAAYRDDEGAGRIKYGWTPGQIAWRRWKIESDLGGDVALFRRDFPSCPEEAWTSGGSKKFNQIAVANLMRDARTLWEMTLREQLGAPKLGWLEAGAGGALWMPGRENAWLWVKEEPAYGRAYALIADPMTGEQSKGSDERDNHAVGVLREEYVDDRGVMHPAEMVACIHVAGGCRWDIDVLAARIVLLSRWYGRCIVIPEVNKAMDLIPPLREAGVNLYLRPAKPDLVNPSQNQYVIGFYSSESTRRMWVSAAAEAIRESKVLCRYWPAVREFDSFVENASGRAEAAPGQHDDWVAMYGIAALCRKAATPMALPRSVPQNRTTEVNNVMAAKGYAAVG